MIPQLVQRAIAAHIDNLNLDVVASVTSGISRGGVALPTDGADNADLPNVNVDCTLARRAGPDSNHYVADVSIRYRVSADDTQEQHFLAQATEVYDAVMTSNLGLLATTASGGTVTLFNVEETDQGYELEGRRWVAFISLSVACCGGLIADIN